MFSPSPIQILLVFFVVFLCIFRFVIMPLIFRKIRASYEPVDLMPPVPVLFCTYCGKPVSNNADTCSVCGAVPTDYRNFCGQCGVPLNPEQMICIKCGTMITNQLTTIPIGADIRQIKDYLEEAIIDLFLIFPLGVMATIFSFQTLNAKKNNDYYRAVHSSAMTKNIIYVITNYTRALSGYCHIYRFLLWPFVYGKMNDF